MTLGVLIKGQRADGLLGFCGLNSSQCYCFLRLSHPPFLPEPAVVALSPSVSTFVWLRRASLCS